MNQIIDIVFQSNDIEAVEQFMRRGILQIGNKALSMTLQVQASETDYHEQLNNELRLCGQREKQIHTLLGTVRIKRGYYQHRQTREYSFPFDRQFGLGTSSYSPGAQRAVSKLGAYLPFGFSDAELLELTGIDFGAKAVERVTKEVGQQVMEYNASSNKRMPKVNQAATPTTYLCMDGTGIPMVASALAGRKGKQTVQAKTREVKLGCVFTQTKTGEDNYPVRDEFSTTYVGGIITAKELGERVVGEMRQRETLSGKKCIIGDGAAWIWNIADELFPGAIQIVDLYHAREHYWNVARLFFGDGSSKAHAWSKRRKEELDKGKVRIVIAAIRRLTAKSEEQKNLQKTEIGYFTKHEKRMRYDLFRKRGLFVGSGVLEAGCKTLIGQRLKQSGMHWSVKGSDAVIALRCCIFSNQWEDFWEKRAAA